MSAVSDISAISGLSEHRLPTQLKLDLLDEKKKKRAEEKKASGRKNRDNQGAEQKGPDKSALEARGRSARIDNAAPRRPASLLDPNKIQNKYRGRRTSGVWFQYTDAKRQGFSNARKDAEKGATFLLLDDSHGPHGASAQTNPWHPTTSTMHSHKSPRRVLTHTKMGSDARRPGSGGLPQRGPTIVDHRRVVSNNLKVVDPLEFKAPPKTKKLADTDWAKYGRPAPRIAREQREQLKPLPTADEERDVFDRAIDKIYNIVVGGPPEEAKTPAKEEGGQQADAKEPSDGKGTLSPTGAESRGNDRKSSAEQMDESADQHNTELPVIAVTAASPHTTLVSPEPRTPAAGPRSPKAVQEHGLLVAAGNTAFGTLGRPPVSRRTPRSGRNTPAASPNARGPPPPPPASLSTSATAECAPQKFPTREAIKRKMSTKPLDLSKVPNKHKNAPVPTLSPEEVRDLSSDSEDESSPPLPPPLTGRDVSPGPPVTAHQSGFPDTAGGKNLVVPGRKVDGTETARGSLDHQGQLTVRSEQAMLQNLKEGVERGDDAFAVVGRPTHAKVLEKAKREGRHIDDLVAVRRIQTMWRKRKSRMQAAATAAARRRDAASMATGNVPASPVKPGCASPKATELPASSRAADVAGLNKGIDEMEQAQTRKEVLSRVEAMLKNISEKTETSESNLVCIPRETYESLLQEIAKENAVFCLPPLYDLPGYPGVRGNFDGLWHIWLTQRAHELRMASAPNDAEAGLEPGPKIKDSSEAQNDAERPAVAPPQTPHTTARAVCASGLGPSAYHVCLRNPKPSSARRSTGPRSEQEGQSGYAALDYDVVGMTNPEPAGNDQVSCDNGGLAARPITGGSVAGLEGPALDTGPITTGNTRTVQPSVRERKITGVDRSLRDLAMFGSEPHRSFDVFWERMKDNGLSGWHY
ncbi:serine-rich adhesin platelets domain-containing [Cystoisospora suis]|uniref:Serine-rich adhesin platelets domain-containing n=1 Tax=Cystoisospora suis TaxID=483139 RepID=A0A2C6L8C1_9APIC|nr:serine-rich adhesin platelets domain-containing [Cystoisospora suis]